MTGPIGDYPPWGLIRAGVYTREGANLWWHAINTNMDDRRPVDLWWTGDRTQMDLVLDEVSRLTGGQDA